MIDIGGQITSVSERMLAVRCAGRCDQLGLVFAKTFTSSAGARMVSARNAKTIVGDRDFNGAFSFRR
jgi:hypothetical protein